MTNRQAQLVCTAYTRLLEVGNAKMTEEQEKSYHQGLAILRQAFPVIDKVMLE